jgi:hypothetical protein
MLLDTTRSAAVTKMSGHKYQSEAHKLYQNQSYKSFLLVKYLPHLDSLHTDGSCQVTEPSLGVWALRLCGQHTFPGASS